MKLHLLNLCRLYALLTKFLQWYSYHKYYIKFDSENIFRASLGNSVLHVSTRISMYNYYCRGPLSLNYKSHYIAEFFYEFQSSYKIISQNITI